MTILFQPQLIMISIKYSEIPSILRNGSFFRSLCEEETDEKIQIPEQCFLWDEAVSSVDDFRRMLKICAFWGLDVIPTEMLKFCIAANSSSLIELVGEEYAAMDFAQDLLKMFAPSLTTTRHCPLIAAITIGRSEAVAYISAIGVAGVEAMAEAAEHGRLDYLELLYHHGHPWDFTACDAAAARGHTDCLRFLHEKGCTWHSTVILNAAEKGHFDCMKYAHEQGLKWHSNTVPALSENGHLEMLKYAVEHGCSLGVDPTHSAASNGHDACLKYLIELGCPVDEFLTKASVLQGGHLLCLKVLIEPCNIRLNEDLISQAAFWGHLHIVQYLHEKSCPWDWEVPNIAAYKGFFNVLFYAIEHGCECIPGTILDTVKTVSEDALNCLKYLIGRGFYVPQNGKLLMAAFAHGNYLAVEYLYKEQPSATVISEEMRAMWSVYLQRSFCDSAEFDSDLAKCIEYARRYNFDIYAEARELIDFIYVEVEKLPLCTALLKS